MQTETCKLILIFVRRNVQSICNRTLNISKTLKNRIDSDSVITQDKQKFREK